MKIKVFDSKTLKNIIEINLALVTRLQNECIIGRSPESGIVLDSPDISRMHAKFVLENENYYFCDLGSRNGSLINGQVAETSRKYLLNPGDTIRLGEFVLILEDINSQSENIAETVYRGLDATIVSSLRDGDYQSPVVNQVPEVVVNEESLTTPEELTTYQETTQVQPHEVPISEDVIETPAEISLEQSQVREAVNQPVEFIETSNTSENTDDDNLEEITLNSEASSESIAHEEAMSSSSENDVVITTGELLVSNDTIEQRLNDLEEVIARETTVIPTDQVADETIVQPREEIEISETSDTCNFVFSEQGRDIPEPDITQPGELDQPLISDYQVETTNNASNDLEEAEPVILVTPETSEVQPDIIEDEVTPEKTTEQKSEIIFTKYIALLAHDSKKTEIAQFAAKHQEFFFNCLTVAPPSVCEILSSQAGVTITEQTSAATSGGYQAIAAKAASGDILAVIFLRDFLQVQSNTANEEAMLRVCNINQVMIATNLPTAEAIVNYIQFSKNILNN
ncbi:MAG: FHA domain-containing protein [Calothrix sp. C42_A2020_038]|nr:FHA domain-containing protein [Calothrix sp. C42_A2020_038]